MRKANAKFLLMYLLSIVILAYFVFGFDVLVRPQLNGSNINLSGNILLNASVIGDGNVTNTTFYFFYAGNGTLAYNVTVYNLSVDDYDFNITINTATFLPDGMYNLMVNATNATGNVTMNNTFVNIRIDNTPPRVTTINSPSENAIYLETEFTNITLNATVTDATLLVHKVFFMVSNSSNTSAIGQFFNLTAGNENGNFWNATVINVSDLKAGNHTITIFANDTVNNTNSSQTVHIIVDSTPPSVLLRNVTFNTSAAPNVFFNFTDNVFATAVNCTLYFNGTAYNSTYANNYTLINITAATLSNGAFVANVSCKDPAGRTGNSTGSINITFDSIAPRVSTINSPSENAIYLETEFTNITLNATITDGTTLVKDVIFQVSNSTGSEGATNTQSFNLTSGTEGGNFWNATILNVSTLKAGNHTITFFANDTVGNINKTQTVHIIVDSTPPSVLLSNVTFNTSAAPNVFFNFTDNVFATAVNCTLYFNGTAYNSTYANNYTLINITAATLSNGAFVANVSCRDQAGRTGNSTKSINITFDSSAPVVNLINNPVNNSYFNGSDELVLLNFTVSDSLSSVARVSFAISNGTVPFNLTGSNPGGNFWNGTINFTLHGLAEAVHNITVNATNLNGLVNSSGSIILTLIYDNTHPNISNATVNAGEITDVSAVLAVVANDSLSGISNCTYSGVGGSGTLIQAAGGSSTYSKTITGLTASTSYTPTVVCIDRAGNGNSTVLATFTTSVAASSSSSSGGGSASGASGGIGTGVEGEFAKEVWGSINGGEEAVLEVENGGIGVTEVDFGVSTTVYGAWVQVDKKASLPSSVSSFSGDSYRFLHITTSSTLKEEYLVDPTIKFKVEKAWLTENGFTKNSVALFHHDDNKWNKLTTTVGNDDGTHVHYTAATPGFSYFVIGVAAGEKVVSEAETVPETEVEVTAEPVPEVGAEAETGAELQEAAKSKAWLWIALVILAVVIVIGIVYGSKKKKK